MEFEQFGLSQELLKAIKELGINKPTQIQEMSIPTIMEGRDIIGESATGSGKTLAFGCAITDYITHGEGLQAMVLTPTRELAEQVKESLVNLSKYKKLKVISIYGGVSIIPQIQELQHADVIVATPGRFLDHLNRKTINVSKIKLLVLDEADRMFDMGFIDDVEKIIRVCPRERQTLFFSATISARVKSLARRHMKDPKEVLAIKLVDPSKLTQIYYNIQRNIKLPLLVQLLKDESAGLVMVFCNTRRNTDFVTKNLRANGIAAIATHGGLSQNKRTRTLDMFNDAKVGVLVCTDVAARGLHIENVSHVYNYDIPKDAKDYIHRIGRTARAGESGKAVSLLCEQDYENFSRIQSEYRDFKIQRTEPPHIIERIKIVGTGGDRDVTRRERNFRRGSRDSGQRGNFSRRRW